MIKIIEKSREFSNVELYLMTQDDGIITMKNVEDGTSIDYNGHIIFEDDKEDGKPPVRILSIISNDKKVYCTNSETFTRSLFNMMSVVGTEFSFIKKSGKTKANRDFITCGLDSSKM